MIFKWYQNIDLLAFSAIHFCFMFSFLSFEDCGVFILCSLLYRVIMYGSMLVVPGVFQASKGEGYHSPGVVGSSNGTAVLDKKINKRTTIAVPCLKLA